MEDLSFIEDNTEPITFSDRPIKDLLTISNEPIPKFDVFGNFVGFE